MDSEVEASGEEEREREGFFFFLWRERDTDLIVYKVISYNRLAPIFVDCQVWV